MADRRTCKQEVGVGTMKVGWRLLGASNTVSRSGSAGRFWLERRDKGDVR